MRRRPIMRQRLLPFALLATLLVVSSGCPSSSGPKRIAVSGKLSVNGQPVPSGTVMARPAEGSTGVGGVGTVADGRYSFDDVSGPEPGKYVLVFNLQSAAKRAPSVSKTPKGGEVSDPGNPGGIDMPGGTAQFEHPIEVPAEGELELDIDLVSKKK